MITLRSIKGFGSFDKVFSKGVKFRTTNILAVVIFKERSNECNNYLYFGVSIGKRYAKKAVVRNRIKRLLRESIRKCIITVDEMKFWYIEQIILTYRNAPLCPRQILLSDVLPEVQTIFEKIIAYKNNRINESI